MRRLLLASAASILAWPCAAGGVTVTKIGNASAAAGSVTLAVPISTTCPLGSGIGVVAANLGNTAINGATDSASTPNAYSLGATLSLGTGRLKVMFVRPNAYLAVNSGGSVTVTYAATSGVKLASAFCIRGANLLGADLAYRDQNGAGATGTSAAPTFTAGTLAVPAELVIGALLTSSAAPTVTEDPTFTNLDTVTMTGELNVAFKVTGATAAPTYAPTLGASALWGDTIISFVQTVGNKMLTGAGQ